MVVTSVDIADLVHDAVETARAGDPSRTWLYQRPNRACVFHSDADRLRQVVDNALANVRVHTSPGTTATTREDTLGPRCGRRGHRCGPGLPRPALPRIFDRFWRHDGSRSRASGGSGLGLAIAAAIVSAHHGHIEATSTDGQGLTIRVTLPASASTPSPTATVEIG